MATRIHGILALTLIILPALAAADLPVWVEDLDSVPGGFRVTFLVDVASAPAALTGFDLQRRTVMHCGTEVVLNAEPWPRPPAGTARFTFDDLTAEPDSLYEYWVVFVDAARRSLDPCSLFDCGAWPWLTCAQRTYAAPFGATFAHSLVYGGGALALPGYDCAQTCGLRAVIEYWPSAMDQWINTGQPLLLAGYLRWEYGGVEGCLYATVTSFEVRDCAVPVSVQSWGALKSAYR